MYRKQTYWISIVALAPLLSASSLAQTPTQAATPGQSQTSGTSTQVPANSTQPGRSNSGGNGVQMPSQASSGTMLPAGPQGPPPVLAPGQAVTLQQALAFGQANEPVFAAAAAARKTAELNKSIAKAALLPSVVYHNQYLFTESNHLPAGSSTQIFIANNSIHEYVSQGQVTESIGFAQYNALAQANTTVAIATAELEVARRGLNATITGLFYTASVSEARIAIQERAVQEAANFVKQTGQREVEREVAHADVLKAQLTLQQRQRDLVDAQLAAAKARLDLGVLLYPDPRTPYTVALPEPAPLPERAVVDAAANNHNPELASATASLKSSQIGVTIAKAAYLPSIVLNYSYGIDSPYFAVHGPDGARNLGYSASATLDIPIFDWFATANKVKQAGIQRDLAKVVLTQTQRRLIASLEQFYAEMKAAHDQAASLQQTVDDARESLRLTRLRYGFGDGTVLEVVDAQNTLTLSELALQDGTVRYQLALANLQTLTGAF